jgi:hypothetical protein
MKNSYTRTMAVLGALILAMAGTCNYVLAQNTTTGTWRYNLSVQMGEVNDLYNYLGMDPEATDGYDAAFDTPKAPAAPGANVQLYFRRPEWSSILGDQFSRDIRAVSDMTDATVTWTFSVLANRSGTAQVSFTNVNPLEMPSVPIYLTNDSGLKLKLNNLQDVVSISLSANIEQTFTLHIGDVTAPVITAGESFTAAKLYAGGQSYRFDWNTTDGTTVVKTVFEYSADRGNTWTTLLDTSAPEFGYDWTVPNVDRVYAPYFRLSAVDFAGNRSEVVDTLDIAIAPTVLGYEKTAGWSLAGVSTFTEQTFGDVFTDPKPYVIGYAYDGTGYVETSQFAALNGLWMGTVEPVMINITGVPFTTETSAILPVGWSIIAPPYVVDVPVAELTFTVGGTRFSYEEAMTNGVIGAIYAYDGSGYVEANVLEEGNGYWIVTLSENVTVNYPIVYPARMPAGKIKPAADDLFTLRAGDAVVRLGVRDGATSGYDSRFDRMAPPASPDRNAINFRILNEQWNSFSSEALTSVRNAGERQSWTLRADAASAEIPLTWSEVPAGGRWYLTTGNKTTELVSGGTISIATGKDFTVVFEPVITSNEAGRAINLALHQNFPNPFNPSTTIAFELPATGNVSLKVFNMAGQEIAALVNGVKTAGLHSVSFDASNLASGVYLYRLQVGGSVITKKMVLLK